MVAFDEKAINSNAKYAVAAVIAVLLVTFVTPLMGNFTTDQFVQGAALLVLGLLLHSMGGGLVKMVGKGATVAGVLLIASKFLGNFQVSQGA